MGESNCMEFMAEQDMIELSNPGVLSKQILSPENSASARVTITEVHLESGACQPRHIHETSEQIWYAIQGDGKLLLADKQTKAFRKGDVVRFADGEVHGLLNDSEAAFMYISVTSPPIDFGYAYENKK